jgi:tetratricopeptide (TPR) repeat protein
MAKWKCFWILLLIAANIFIFFLNAVGQEVVTNNSLDKSIGILEVVGVLMGVLVALITLVVIVGGAFGFFEYKRWKELRKDAESSVKEAKKGAEDAKKCAEEAKPIVDAMKKSKEEIESLRESIGKLPSLTEPLSEEMKRKLDEYGKKIEFLEAFGMPLTYLDYANRGFDLFHKKQYELALRAFEKEIELKPDNANAWSNKGGVLNALGRHDEALRACEKAIELKPDYADPWVNKVAVLGSLGRHDEALSACEKAIELKPDYDSAWYNKACAYSLKKDKDNALLSLRRAVELNSKYREKAKQDKDFEWLWEDEDFKKIVM